MLPFVSAGRSRWVLLGLVVVMLLVPGAQAWAQPPTPSRPWRFPFPLSLPSIFGAPEDNPEIESIVLQIELGRAGQAQDRAERLLAADGGTYASYYVMGRMYHECVGDMARAYWFLSRARQMLESKHGEKITSSLRLRNLHRNLLRQLARLCQNMDRYEEALAILRDHDRLYSPKLISHYGWVLMKLGRYEEARQACQMALRMPMADRLEALNALAAINYLDDRYEEAFDAIRRLAATSASNVVVDNAGEIATSLLRFDDAERYLLQGTRGYEPLSKSRAWERLAMLYASQGRLPEAVAAVRLMHRWYARTEPADAQQIWAEYQLVSASIMLAASSDEKALQVARRVLTRPDRRGGFSGHQHQFEITLLAFYYETLIVRRERLREEMSWCSLPRWWQCLGELVALERDAWWTRNRAAAQTLENQRLAWSLRPYATDSMLLEVLRPVMNDLLGAGVAGAESRRLLGRTDSNGTRERPYILALQGEGLLARGQPREAVAALQAALDGLPPAEVLLRARLQALMGQAAWRLGDGRGTNAWYEQAMEKQPQVMRLLGARVPVQIEGDSGPAASRAAALVARSPRFQVTSGGFLIRIQETTGGLAGVLLSPGGSVLATCTTPSQGDAEATARAFCHDLHERAFSPRIDLSQTDVNSLDGSNETGDVIRDQARDLAP